MCIFNCQPSIFYFCNRLVTTHTKFFSSLSHGFYGLNLDEHKKNYIDDSNFSEQQFHSIYFHRKHSRTNHLCNYNNIQPTFKLNLSQISLSRLNFLTIFSVFPWLKHLLCNYLRKYSGNSPNHTQITWRNQFCFLLNNQILIAVFIQCSHHAQIKNIPNFSWIWFHCGRISLKFKYTIRACVRKLSW